MVYPSAYLEEMTRKGGGDIKMNNGPEGSWAVMGELKNEEKPHLENYKMTLKANYSKPSHHHKRGKL